MRTFPHAVSAKIHHNFCKLVLYLLVNMNNFIRSFDMICTPTNDTIFRGFFIPGGFLHLYSKILSVTWIKNIFPRKTIGTVIFKLEASPTTSVRLFVCQLCDFNFDSIAQLRDHKEKSHVSRHNFQRSQMTQKAFSL